MAHDIIWPGSHIRSFKISISLHELILDVEVKIVYDLNTVV